MPKFSICMPVYNVEKYVAESIESVLRQDFSDWELIAIDDGSKDRSGILCDQYAEKDPRIRVIHKENQGLISARRLAFSKAAGDYIISLDSDDFLEDNCLSALAGCIDDNHPDMILYTYNLYRGGKKIVHPHCFPGGKISPQEVRRELSYSFRINSMCSKCIRSEVLQADPISYEQFYGSSYGEDLLQSLYPATVCEKIYVLPFPLYNYRVNEGSMTVNVSMEQLNKVMNLPVYRLARSYMDKWGLNQTEDIENFAIRFLDHLVQIFKIIYLQPEFKKSCTEYPWENFIDNETRSYCKSKKIPLQRRLLLDAIIHHRYFLLRLYSPFIRY